MTVDHLPQNGTRITMKYTKKKHWHKIEVKEAAKDPAFWFIAQTERSSILSKKTVAIAAPLKVPHWGIGKVSNLVRESKDPKS